MDEYRPPAAPETVAMAAVNRRLRRGAFVSVAAVIGLAVATTLSFWDVVGIPLFYVLLPAVALAQLPLLRTEEFERMTVYAGSAVTILGVGLLALALGWRLDGLEGLGLRLPPGRILAAWTVGVTAAGLAVVGGFMPFDRALREERMTFLVRLLPRTAREKRAFTGLSFAAGVGEELAYRGYALASLQLLGPGPWTAAAASSVAFGFLHAYQGPIGILRTAVMGCVLAVPVITTGSLVPAMLGHTLIDLFAGFVLGPRLIRRSEDGPASFSGG